MEPLVIFPGRFQIFHRGHKSTYDYLVDQFGPEAVYIATSNVQAPLTSPFSFTDKVQMMSKLGIPSSHIAQVKNPYQANEITKQADPANTVLVFAVSEKDMSGDKSRFKFGTKKDGSKSYLQPWPEDLNEVKPMTEHGYVLVAPTVNFKVLDNDTQSASELRKLYLESDLITRKDIIAELYGDYDIALNELFDQRLNITQKADQIHKLSQNPKVLSKLSESAIKRLFGLVRNILLAESKQRASTQLLTEQTTKTGYLTER